MANITTTSICTRFSSDIGETSIFEAHQKLNSSDYDRSEVNLIECSRYGLENEMERKVGYENEARSSRN